MALPFSQGWKGKQERLRELRPGISYLSCEMIRSQDGCNVSCPPDMLRWANRGNSCGISTPGCGPTPEEPWNLGVHKRLMDGVPDPRPRERLKGNDGQVLHPDLRQPPRPRGVAMSQRQKRQME